MNIERKYLLLYCLAVIFSLTALSAGAAPKERWLEFKPKSGEFSILMPKRPIEETLDNGVVPGATYISAPASEEDSAALYKATIIYDDLKKEDLNSESYIMNLLGSMRDSYLASSGCTLVKSDIITWNGRPAIDITSDCMGYQTIFSRFVVTEKFIVGAMVIYPSGVKTYTNKARYLESLKIMK